jgi:hypothetical protein
MRQVGSRRTPVQGLALAALIAVLVGVGCVPAFPGGAELVAETAPPVAVPPSPAPGEGPGVWVGSVSITAWDDTPSAMWPIGQLRNTTVYETRDHGGAPTDWLAPASWSTEASLYAFRSGLTGNCSWTHTHEGGGQGSGTDGSVWVSWNAAAATWRIQATAVTTTVSGVDTFSWTNSCGDPGSSTSRVNFTFGEQDLFVSGDPAAQVLVGSLETGDVVRGSRFEWRLWRASCDPAVDSDADRLGDCAEVATWGTDHLDPDSDGGGVGDGQELLDDSTDPRVASDDGVAAPDVNLTWPAAFDQDEGDSIAYYAVEVDGVVVDQVSATTCALTGLASGTSYDYSVTAYSANGDWSGSIGAPVASLGRLSSSFTTPAGVSQAGTLECADP